ncbi:carbonic anhydrase [Candidatus Koribacter versatilis Ellin345]|uniref:carbonic anhydrase n=1 Tax=Koribacter versatilis (strain Ellin345) TaxID=204669 RepID=Q1IQD8_KORVE|nr:carbonic anhydrase [Candidatus Koribacter versatilis]ABF40912.1 carbonic anhydrase [Candidatus Koribacter versatilis Ellin345]
MADHASVTEVSAEEALQKLLEGNARFVRGEARFPTVCKETLAALARGQHPFATILGCSDSRVPPELLFDANFGELFIIRVAGNVISNEVKGSLQYAGAHLRTPLFVVLGHQKCGAVAAALHYRKHAEEERSYIQILVENIAAGLPPTLDGADDEMDAAVEANVRWSVEQIRRTPEWENAVKAGGKIHGAVFQITSGEVRFLDV